MTRSLRRPTLADLPAVGALFRARDIARVGVPELSDAELAHDWASPGFELARDAWLVEDGNEAVAYADLFREEPASFLVETVTAAGHEDLEPELLDLAEARAAELTTHGGPVTLRALVVAVEVERAGRYEGAGYRYARTFLRMRLEPDDAGAQPDWPAGVEVAPFDPVGDALEVHALLSAAFEDHHAIARPGDLRRWQHDTIEHPGFDPGCWVLARERGRLVGAVVALPEDGVGWIKALGVARDARGRGIAAAMLAEAFRRLRRRGLAAIELGVDADSPTGATRLYERAGMRVARRNDIYEKVVTRAPA